MKDYIFCDIECYHNYLLIMFYNSKETNYKIELHNNALLQGNNQTLLEILKTNTIVTFNGINYDKLILDAYLYYSNKIEDVNKKLKVISDSIITSKLNWWEVYAKFNFEKLKWDHIDVVNLSLNKAKLKILGGRLHTKKLQDLPLAPSATIYKEQLELMRLYCLNDLKLTREVFETLYPQIKLRETLTDKYNVDLRSKSDSQIAEVIIKNAIEEETDEQLERPENLEGTTYNYRRPEYIKFNSKLFNNILKQYQNNTFVVNEKGHLDFNFDITQEDVNKKGVLPTEKPKFKFTFNNLDYTIGLGGLHSVNKKVNYKAGNDKILIDFDVTSYYPSIILANGYYPDTIGMGFLEVYKNLVETRKRAKLEGDKITDKTFKIVVNGTFGKLASKYSYLYAPDLMLQVTVTGQLSLLMLIEMFEEGGISVVSANTDGVTIFTKKENKELAYSIAKTWQTITSYNLEDTIYNSLYYRDVNSYIGFGESGITTKGFFKIHDGDLSSLSTNPSNTICKLAVIEYLKNNTHPMETIKSCIAISKFTTLRTVKGGATKDGVDLGGVIRWYYSTDAKDAIHYKSNNNKVPATDGAKVVLDYPSVLPNDIDYDKYFEICKDMLIAIGIKT